MLATTFAMTVARLNEWPINFKAHAATQTTPVNALAHSRLSSINFQRSTLAITADHADHADEADQADES